MAEQVERIEAEPVEQVAHVGDQLIERVRGRVAGVRAVAVTAVVERDDRAVAGKRIDDVGPVERAAGESVHQHQRPTTAVRRVREFGHRMRT